MLDDRSYLRSDSTAPRPSVCVVLIVTLVAVFLAQNMGAGRAFDFDKYLALSKEGLSHLYLWQVFTFQFLHAGPWPWHLLFNCLALYFLGRDVEEAVGGKNFLILYLLSGLIGGILQAGLMFLPLPGANSYVVGASAGVAGVFTAYALLFPHREMMLFLLPLRIKVQHLFYFFVALSIFGTFVRIGNVAHAAHLGGIATGFAYLRWGMQAQSFLSWRGANRRRLRPRQLMKVPAGRNAGWLASKEPEPDVTPEEFISKEVDPILDKISAQGIQSLTPKEKQILEAARARMEKR